MKVRALFAILAVSLAVTGCGLLPKKVELFQDKVARFPEPTFAMKEVQREAAQRAKEKAAEVLSAAIVEDASSAVTLPAKETVLLTDAVSDAVGPPASRPTLDSLALADSVRATLAKQSKKVDSFKEDNNENSGKKIEGTGLVSVPYFAWAGGFVLIVFVGWHLAKTALTVASAANPGAAVGVGGMNVAGSVVSKGFSQLVTGGKDFLAWTNKEITDPALKQKIVDAFKTAHKTSQDKDVKAVVDNLIKA